MQVVASFSWTADAPKTPFGFTVLGGSANITIDCGTDSKDAPCMLQAQTGSPPPRSVTGPVLPVDAKTVTVHTIVDHEIVETIANNRTAMVTYHKSIPSAASTAVTIIGAGPGSGVTGTIKSWSLDAANNAGPQP